MSKVLFLARSLLIRFVAPVNQNLVHTKWETFRVSGAETPGSMTDLMPLLSFHII